MSSAGSNTANVMTQIPLGQTINLASDKSYWLVNIDGVSNNVANAKQIQLYERQTGRVLNISLYGIMKVEGKKWSSVTYVSGNFGSETLYITDEGIDAENIYIDNLIPSIINRFMNQPIITFPASVYVWMSSVTFSSSLTAQTIFQFPQGNILPFTMFVSNYGAASGETDSITVVDINDKTYLNVNITNAQNQKIILPISWNSGSYNPEVIVSATGVTAPTGTVTYTIYEGVVS